MRLGTAMVEACCAAQIDANNKVNRAIASMVLKWRIETPRDVEVAFAEEIANLSLCLLTCVVMVTSLWSGVVATVGSDTTPVRLWVVWFASRPKNGCRVISLVWIVCVFILTSLWS